LIRAALRHEFQVRHLVARGWTLDLSKSAPAASASIARSAQADGATAAPKPESSLLASAQAAESVNPAGAAVDVFRGVFTRLQFPVDVSFDDVELEGAIILPAPAGQPTTTVHAKIRGGGLAAGREGIFAIDAVVAAPGGSIAVRGTTKAAMDTPRTFIKIAAKANAALTNAQFPNGVQLDVTLGADRRPDGESYQVLLARADKPLISADAEFVRSASRITGEWKLDLRDTDLTPFALGRQLPVFTAAGEGNCETGLALDEIHVAGELKSSVEQLGRIRPELSAIGPMKIATEFDVLHQRGAFRVERLDVRVGGTAPIAGFQTLQPFEFNPMSAQLSVADPAQDLVAISLTGVPIAWVRPFLGPLAVTGGDVSGELAASAREGGLSLRAKTPLTMLGASLSENGRALLRGVDLSLKASADYTPHGWQIEVKDFGVRSSGATILLFDAKAGQLAGASQPIKVTGRWTADLPGWLRQPVADGTSQISTGVAEGEFAGSLDGTKAIELKLAFSGLATATKEKLPTVRLNVRADVAADGAIAFSVPVLFEAGDRKSDLLAAGTLTPSPQGLGIDARVTSEMLSLRDLGLLGASIAPLSTPAKSDETSGATTPRPFWSSVHGQVAFALKKIAVTESILVTDVGGIARLGDSTLHFDGVHAVLPPDSDFKLDGSVAFAASAPQPYGLTAQLALNNFDTGRAFGAIDPVKLPTIDTRVNLSAHLAGAGTSVDQMVASAGGEVRVAAKTGVFRALAVDLSDRVEKKGSTVAGILGAVTGKQQYEDYANKSQIFSDITKALREIPFDQLSFTTQPGPQGDVELKDFTLISPEARLTGAGVIHYADGTLLLGRPLELELKIGARGKLGDLLKRARLLEDKQDSLGYAALSSTIRLTGTPANPDAAELREAILNSALEKNGIMDRVLGR